MAEKSFQDVIDRIVAEGQLTRNSGSHSIRTVKDVLRDQNKATKAQTDELKNAIGKAAGSQIASQRQSDNLTKGDQQEQAREQDTFENKMLTLLEGILANTAGALVQKEKEDKPKSKETTLIDIGLGAILAGGTLGVLGGLIAGYVKALDELIPGFERLRKAIPRFFKNMLTAVPRLVQTTLKAIRSGLLLIEDGFVKAFPKLAFNIGMTISIVTTRMKKAFFSIGEQFASAIKALSQRSSTVRMFQEGFEGLGEIGQAFRNLFSGNLVAKAKGPIRFITDGINSVVNFFKATGQVFAKVVSVVGKVFAPIAFIMGIFDFASGAIEGFQKTEGNMMQKLLGGLVGGIKGLLDGMIAVPLDMLKNGIAYIMEFFGADPSTVDSIRSFSFSQLLTDLFDAPLEMLKKAGNWITDKLFGLSMGEMLESPFESVKMMIAKYLTLPYDLLIQGVAWIAEKLGFGEFAETLASFSVYDEVMKIFTTIQETVTSAIDGIVEMFISAKEAVSGAISSAGDAMEGFIKEILRSILPDPSVDREWYDPIALVQKAIPDSVYRYAGIDPETGEMEPIEPAIPPIEVPETTVEPALNTEELERGVAAAQNSTRIEIPVETRAPVVGTAVETDDVRVERSDVTGREAQQLALQQQQREVNEQRDAANQQSSIINAPSNVSNQTNVNNSNATFGMTGTSGDPLDKSWGGI